MWLFEHHLTIHPMWCRAWMDVTVFQRRQPLRHRDRKGQVPSLPPGVVIWTSCPWWIFCCGLVTGCDAGRLLQRSWDPSCSLWYEVDIAEMWSTPQRLMHLPWCWALEIWWVWDGGGGGIVLYDIWYHNLLYPNVPMPTRWYLDRERVCDGGISLVYYEWEARLLMNEVSVITFGHGEKDLTSSITQGKGILVRI
jgi:hypothetical protein